MEFIKEILVAVFHLDKHLDFVIKNFGAWSHLLLFAIIFCETGLVILPFLPGDSLLFVVGTFAAKGSFNLFWVSVVLISAAIIGDTVNYFLGKFFGERILLKFQHRFIKKSHVERTHKFYEKYGGKTIILARFVPIIRTFAPFVAGIGEMSYYKFLLYNVIGGILWVLIFVLSGYYFGNVPIIKNNFSITIFVVILISILPIIFEFYKHHKSKASCAK